MGLAWAGSPEHPDDRKRSIALEALAPLARAEGVEFHSLQKGLAAAQVAAPPAGMKLIDHDAELKDFSDTAALVANLDLVISVDTAPAHLAAAMGKPVWLMITATPDWRWQLKREDSPWYPSMRLFRQEAPSQWSAVVERVAARLAERARQ